MLNVNQITSTLAKLPDQQLQQYAAMHKNDPYIVSLAVAESNRRKAMRDDAQARGPQGPQPKVVDEDIAAMHAALPEDQGIARLPTGDMNFAGGGIIAFAGGGTPTAGTPYEIPGLTAGNMYSGAFPAMPAAPEEDDPLAEAEAMSLRFNGRRLTPDERKRVEVKLAADAAAAQAGAAAGKAGQPYIPGFAGAVPTSSAAAPAAAPTAKPGAAPVPAGAQGAAAAQATPPAAQGAAPSMGRIGMSSVPDTLASYRQINDLTAQQTYPELTRMRGELASGLKGLAEEDLRLTKERDAKFADALKPREERLAQREAGLEREKEENKGLALLQTGMALMSTPGPIGQAFGKAALMGTDKYASGLDKLKAAQDRLDMAKDQLDDLKLNRAEMSAKEIQDKQLGIKRSALEGNKLMLEGYEKTLGLNKQDAHNLLTAVTSSGNARLGYAAAVDAANIRYGGLGGAGGKSPLPVLKAQLDLYKSRVKTPFDESQFKQSDPEEYARYVYLRDAVAQAMANLPGAAKMPATGTAGTASDPLGIR